MKFYLPHLTIVLAIILCASCSDGGDGPVVVDPASGTLIHASSCKQSDTIPRFGKGSTSESCVEFSFNPQTSTLHLRHINAGFNCCPGELSASITVDKGIITITEKEREAACRCNCLYDLEFVINNLSAGTYRIVVMEPYLPAGADALDFMVELAKTPSGSHCVVRTGYPWGM